MSGYYHFCETNYNKKQDCLDRKRYQFPYLFQSHNHVFAKNIFLIIRWVFFYFLEGGNT